MWFRVRNPESLGPLATSCKLLSCGDVPSFKGCSYQTDDRECLDMIIDNLIDRLRKQANTQLSLST